jgi:hypothetical protein
MIACQLLETFQSDQPLFVFFSSHHNILVSILLFFLQLASLPIEHKSQNTQVLSRTLLARPLPASIKKTKPVPSHATVELLVTIQYHVVFENFPKPEELVETFQNKWSFWKLFRTGGAFGNFPGHYMETFQNMDACMAIHETKTKPVDLLVGRRPFCWQTVAFLDVIPGSMCSPSSDGSCGMHS